MWLGRGGGADLGMWAGSEEGVWPARRGPGFYLVDGRILNHAAVVETSPREWGWAVVGWTGALFRELTGKTRGTFDTQSEGVGAI